MLVQSAGSPPECAAVQLAAVQVFSARKTGQGFIPLELKATAKRATHPMNNTPRSSRSGRPTRAAICSPNTNCEPAVHTMHTTAAQPIHVKPPGDFITVLAKSTASLPNGDSVIARRAARELPIASALLIRQDLAQLPTFRRADKRAKGAAQK